MKAVLGIDTSCYTTSCAVADDHCSLLSQNRMLLPVKEGMRGLRQSEAVFIHLKQLPLLLEKTKAESRAEIVALSVSSKPTQSADSYMPVFQAGLSIAQSIAAAMGIPCYQTNHQQGHLRAALIENYQFPGEYLALHLSGGTTDLLLVSQDKVQPFAASLDLHAGQLIDRVGVSMGLMFPSGPELQKLASRGRITGRYGVKLKGLNCHLSGAEALALRDIRLGILTNEDIAAEVLDFLARTVCGMLQAAQKETGIKDALIFGGVASSALLRQLMAERLKEKQSTLNIVFSLPEFSGDNAAGVALIGARMHFNEQKGG